MSSSDANTTQQVTIRTGARLHFGLLTTRSDAGRLGGIGMMTDRPGGLLRAEFADEDIVRADPVIEQRVRRYLDGLRAELERHCPDAATKRYRVEVPQAIPSHQGFGSGTQLAFAVAAAMTALLRWESFVPTESLERGERSLVGSIGFHRGGFIVDPGEVGPWPLNRASGDEPRRPIVKPVPNEWRVVLVRPGSAQGQSGTSEAEAFDRLKPMPKKATERLVELVSDTILPSLELGTLPDGRGTNFEAFAAGVTEFNRTVGEHFAAVQGGIYAHPLVRELSRLLVNTEWPHIAQSSWGPTAAVFCENSESATALCDFLGARDLPGEATLTIAAPLNRGADVRMPSRTDE